MQALWVCFNPDKVKLAVAALLRSSARARAARGNLKG